MPFEHLIPEFALLGRASVMLAASALLVGGWLWLLRPQRAALHRLAWCLVLLQGVMLWPLSLEIPWYQPAQETPQDAVIASADVGAFTVPAVSLSSKGPFLEVADSAATTSLTPNTTWSLSVMLGAVWAAGLLIWLGRDVLGVMQMWHLVRTSRPAADDWDQPWQALLREQNLRRRPIPLRVTESWGPLLCWTPGGYCVLVPQQVWSVLSLEQRQAILQHELSHFHRGDLWMSLAARMVVAVHWFNPLAWWAARRFDEAAEWACDESVVAHQSPTDFARALLELASAPPTVSVAHASGSPVAVRIRRVLSINRRGDSNMKTLLIGMLSVMLLLACVRVELVAQAVEPGDQLVLAPSDDLRKLSVDPREQSIRLGLEWLAAHVEKDGGWSLRFGVAPRHEGPVRDESPREMRTAATGMTLLAFLSAGQTQQQGKYRELVKGGLGFLEQQAKVSPRGADLRGEGGSMYNHAIATLALCEAVRRTKDVKLAKLAQQAVDFTVAAQDAQSGGWRYSPNQPGDTSSTGWQVRSLSSAHAAGLKVPQAAFDNAMTYLDSVAVNGGAGYGYTTPGNRPGTNAVGLVARMQLGWKQNHAGMAAGLQAIFANQVADDAYLNFHISSLARELGKGEADHWLNKVQDRLVKQQIDEGKPEAERGSWTPAEDGHGRSGGRLLNTALAVQILAEKPRGYWKPATPKKN